ncbi:MAG: hypothetical protein VKO44_05820 [Cyanobacteriota bacterium]|nr:hypothetical protein [Cyanobacteriota bacterium]
MALRLPPHRSRQRLRATLLMEAILAASMAMLVLAVVAPLWQVHVKHMKKARDLDLLEALVIKDINSFRQYASQWKAQSGPYSNIILPDNKELTKVSPRAQVEENRGATSYEAADYCLYTGNLEQQFRSDLGAYKTYFDSFAHLANSTTLSRSRTFDDVPPYKLKRVVERPLDFDPANPDVKAFTLRLRYTLFKSDGVTPATDLPFRRTADVQVEAQYAC